MEHAAPVNGGACCTMMVKELCERQPGRETTALSTGAMSTDSCSSAIHFQACCSSQFRPRVRGLEPRLPQFDGSNSALESESYAQIRKMAPFGQARAARTCSLASVTTALAGMSTPLNRKNTVFLDQLTPLNFICPK